MVNRNFIKKQNKLSMPRRPNDDIRRFILDRIDEHPRDMASMVVTSFNVSRVTANNYLRKLVEEGLILGEGNTRGRKYTSLPIKVVRGHVDITPDLQDDDVWRRQVRPVIRDEKQNIIDICAYGFTEIFNNVIDHSASKHAVFSVSIYPTILKLMISDTGVGIFEKIKQDFNLYDRREAILELSKGKLTSDPSKHSGEGIFFTSRMFDNFIIRSLDLTYIKIREPNDQWLLEVEYNDEITTGTRITMEVFRNIDRTTKGVFDQFVDDEYRFSKTHVPILLAKVGEDQLVSRSQAKRVLARVEKFSEICLDFAGVHSIGQAFADEIFRVFAQQHPEISIVTLSLSDNVRGMIEHVMSRQASSDGQGRLL